MLESEVYEEVKSQKDIFADLANAKRGSFMYVGKDRLTVYGPFDAYDFEARAIFTDLKRRDLISYFRFTYSVSIVDGEEFYEEVYRFSWTAKTGWRLPENAQSFSNGNVIQFLCGLCGLKHSFFPIKISGKAVHDIYKPFKS